MKGVCLSARCCTASHNDLLFTRSAGRNLKTLRYSVVQLAATPTLKHPACPAFSDPRQAVDSRAADWHTSSPSLAMKMLGRLSAAKRSKLALPTIVLDCCLTRSEIPIPCAPFGLLCCQTPLTCQWFFLPSQLVQGLKIHRNIFDATANCEFAVTPP